MLAMTLLFTLCQGVDSSGPAASAGTRARSAAEDDRFGIRLLEAPVKRRGDPRALYQIVDHLAPGTTIHRRVQVTNLSAKALHFQMGATAAGIDRSRFTVAAANTASELTSWISFDRDSFEVPAYGNAPVKVTIKVPPDASKGERYAVIWAQVAAPANDVRNVGVNTQVGIRVYLDIGPGGEPPSDFRIEKLIPARAKEGQAEVSAMVHNTGGRALDMSGSFTLSDGPGGLRAGPYPATLGTTLAPGDRAPVVVRLDERLPNGPWEVRLSLSSGLIKRTVTATLTFPAAGGTGPPVEVRSNGVLHGALLAGVPAVAVLLLLLVRRRRSGRG
ncbi:hypothetical protein GCM10010517_69800 [Streptosporangium fragile]|uniref:Peptidase n=1 Tax=Streptosporangium fragile TaxID=46186 RepID=A0ABP6IQ83_9ACTN